MLIESTSREQGTFDLVWQVIRIHVWTPECAPLATGLHACSRAALVANVGALLFVYGTENCDRKLKANNRARGMSKGTPGILPSVRSGQMMNQVVGDKGNRRVAY